MQGDACDMSSGPHGSAPPRCWCSARGIASPLRAARQQAAALLQPATIVSRLWFNPRHCGAGGGSGVAQIICGPAAGRPAPARPHKVWLHQPGLRGRGSDCAMTNPLVSLRHAVLHLVGVDHAGDLCHLGALSLPLRQRNGGGGQHARFPTPIRPLFAARVSRRSGPFSPESLDPTVPRP